MQWKKVDKREWRAEGKYGTWTITQCGKTFWGRYASHNGAKSFRMRPASKISEAKAACESNYYWEKQQAEPVKQESKPQGPCGPVQQTIPI